MQDQTRVIQVLGFGAAYIRDFTVIMFQWEISWLLGLINTSKPEQNGYSFVDDTL